MTPQEVLLSAVDPALSMLARYGVASDDRARVDVLTIAGQESGWKDHVQLGGGPAHSLWQFELGGGVTGLFHHALARPKLNAALAELGIPQDQDTVFAAMVDNDVLAAAMARLLLWTDPAPLPELDQQTEAWRYYLRLWRPGIPRPESWPARYGTALEVVKSNIV